MNKTRKNIQLGVLIGLICAVILNFAGFDARAQTLRENLLRLHIIAASDTKADQEIKLKVRDAILAECDYCFEGCKDLQSAILKAEENLGAIQEVAQKTLLENGFLYEAKVSISDSFFSTRVYDDFTLPAGVYKALKVELGKAQGKNWWCVVFPAVCLPSASSGKLTDAVREDSAEIALKADKYIFRFKTVEVYEDIKQLISR